MSIELTLTDALEDVGEEDDLSDHLEGSHGSEEVEVNVELRFTRYISKQKILDYVKYDLPVTYEWSEDGETSDDKKNGIEEVRIREEVDHQPSHADGEVVGSMVAEPLSIKVHPKFMHVGEVVRISIVAESGESE